MNKLYLGLLCVSLLFTNTNYYGSTTAPVTIAGAIIKAKHVQEVTKKYKRKDCPVCKGKGWYMSGDGIKKIDCSYCEPSSTNTSVETTRPTISSPAMSTATDCVDGQCPPKSNKIIIRR